jgi:hypothetical protein
MPARGTELLKWVDGFICSYNLIFFNLPGDTIDFDISK